MQYLKGKVLQATCFKSLFSCSGNELWRKLILSAYCIDYEWLMRELPSNYTELVLIQHSSEGEAAGIRKGRFMNKNLSLLSPPFPQFPRFGVMHCKLMLMLGEESMRLVISSGNLMEFDYNGEVANVLFVQDLPKLKSQSASSVDSLLNGQFYRSLSALLEEFGCFRHPGVVLDTRELEAYDWRVIDERIRLVYSVPGYFDVGSGWRSNCGVLMLNSVVKDLVRDVVKKEDQITIEYQGSSLGTITRDWLDDFGKCSVGTFPLTRKRQLEEESPADPSFSFKIVFPSLQTVKKSACGPQGFGTIFSKGKDFRSPGCPREWFHDCRSGEGIVSERPMHSKIMTVMSGQNDGKAVISEKEIAILDSNEKEIVILDSNEKEIVILDSDEEELETNSKSHVLYRYLGSHNFTAAAWGRFLKDGTKLMINNYEVGVLVPADFEFPYTYHRPPRPYAAEDEPWDQTAYFN